MILMFADIEALPVSLQAVLYLIPYTHVVLASKAAFMENYAVMLRSIFYITIFTILILYVAARIFMTEKVVTARFSWRRKR